MKQTRWATAILAAILIFLCWMGNRTSGEEHRFSAFPWLIAVLAFPLVLWPSLSAEARRPGASKASLRRTVFKIVGNASVLFALAAVPIAAWQFGETGFDTLALAFTTAFVPSAVLGYLCGLGIAANFSHRPPVRATEQR